MKADLSQKRPPFHSIQYVRITLIWFSVLTLKTYVIRQRYCRMESTWSERRTQTPRYLVRVMENFLSNSCKEISAQGSTSATSKCDIFLLFCLPHILLEQAVQLNIQVSFVPLILSYCTIYSGRRSIESRNSIRPLYMVLTSVVYTVDEGCFGSQTTLVHCHGAPSV